MCLAFLPPFLGSFLRFLSAASSPLSHLESSVFSYFHELPSLLPPPPSPQTIDHHCACPLFRLDVAYDF